MYLPEYNQFELFDETFSCAGTLINRDTILTAGHCVPTTLDYSTYYADYVFNVTMLPSMYSVYLGMYNISLVNYGDLQGGVKVNVAQLIRVCLTYFLNFSNKE